GGLDRCRRDRRNRCRRGGGRLLRLARRGRCCGGGIRRGALVFDRGCGSVCRGGGRVGRRQRGPLNGGGRGGFGRDLVGLRQRVRCHVGALVGIGERQSDGRDLVAQRRGGRGLARYWLAGHGFGAQDGEHRRGRLREHLLLGLVSPGRVDYKLF